MSRRSNRTPSFGNRKLIETLKFVLRAIVFAFILVNFGKTWNIVSSVYTWCTKIDLGYVWVINIAAGAAIVGLIGLVTRKKRKQYPTTIRIVKILIFVLVVLIIECFAWHLKDSWEMLKAPIDTSDIILAVLGLVAATLSFVWHLRGVNYDDEYYEEDEYEGPPEGEEEHGEEPKREPKGEPKRMERSGFNWIGGDDAE